MYTVYIYIWPCGIRYMVGEYLITKRTCGPSPNSCHNVNSAQLYGIYLHAAVLQFHFKSTKGIKPESTWQCPCAQSKLHEDSLQRLDMEYGA